MITREKAFEISRKKDPGEVEKISIVIRYIFDITKEDISDIKIQPPQHSGHVILLHHMFNIAKNYYYNG